MKHVIQGGLADIAQHTVALEKCSCSHDVCITIAVPGNPLNCIYAKTAEPAAEWLLLQLADSSFPGGGFAHSGGLEAAAQQGLIRCGEDLRPYIDAQLACAVYAAAPFVMEVHRHPESFPKVDSTCDAFLSNHVANRASRAQGGSFLAAVERIFPGEAGAKLNNLRARCRAASLPGHFAPVLGSVSAFLGLDAPRTCRLVLFLALRGTISSAVRLGIVGPLEGQTIQFGFAGRIEQWAIRAGDVGLDDAAQCAPVLDLVQASHDRLYSRLFQS